MRRGAGLPPGGVGVAVGVGVRVGVAVAVGVRVRVGVAVAVGVGVRVGVGVAVGVAASMKKSNEQPIWRQASRRSATTSRSMRVPAFQAGPPLT
jgi:hypothetical protein